MKYRLIYWPHTGNLSSDWFKDPAIEKRLRRVTTFEAKNDGDAKHFASGVFSRCDSDGVDLQRFTLNNDCEWQWENIFSGKVDYTK